MKMSNSRRIRHKLLKVDVAVLYTGAAQQQFGLARGCSCNGVGSRISTDVCDTA